MSHSSSWSSCRGLEPGQCLFRVCIKVQAPECCTARCWPSWAMTCSPHPPLYMQIFKAWFKDSGLGNTINTGPCQISCCYSGDAVTIQGIWGQVLGEVLAAVHLPTVQVCHSETRRAQSFCLQPVGSTAATCPPSPSRASSKDCR